MDCVTIPDCTPAKQNQPYGAPHGTKTILVVEDEAFVREATCDLLEERGYHVLWAENAATAKILFSWYASEVDLALCDAVLPDGNGIVLGQGFRQECPNLKLVFLSGYPLADPEQQLQNGGGTAFIAKPYSSSTLMPIIGGILNQN
jgi:two-component system, cell cycle sensor histidine kinase and response regulator CckA